MIRWVAFSSKKKSAEVIVYVESNSLQFSSCPWDVLPLD